MVEVRGGGAASLCFTTRHVDSQSLSKQVTPAYASLVEYEKCQSTILVSFDEELDLKGETLQREFWIRLHRCLNRVPRILDCSRQPSLLTRRDVEGTNRLENQIDLVLDPFSPVWRDWLVRNSRNPQPKATRRFVLCNRRKVQFNPINVKVGASLHRTSVLDFILDDSNDGVDVKVLFGCGTD